MISLTRLLGGPPAEGDRLRYGAAAGRDPEARGPVVVWNVTRRCGLACRHCYAAATDAPDPAELSTTEGMALLDDLAVMGCPAVLLSGGEPLDRPDLPELAAHATALGLRTALSTNGVRLDASLAARLKASGLAYAGISVDGKEAAHDRLRGRPGAYRRALAGLRAARAAGLKTGLRHTLTRDTLDQVDHLFDLLEAGEADRLCFYHLVPAGRADSLRVACPSATETRRALDRIFARTQALVARGGRQEVLTVDNHADGPYLVLGLQRRDPARAEVAQALLKTNGGNRSGSGLGCVSWDGTVFADQFWRTRPLGNVRVRPFHDLWRDPSIRLLTELRSREGRVQGRCAACRFWDLCRGNLRARAEALTGDPWASDPGCYLTDDEIAMPSAEDFGA
jgi:radical SAM protein with 4Fe4S-binding SPASM domain